MKIWRYQNYPLFTQIYPLLPLMGDVSFGQKLFVVVGPIKVAGSVSVDRPLDHPLEDRVAVVVVRFIGEIQFVTVIQQLRQLVDVHILH